MSKPMSSSWPGSSILLHDILLNASNTFPDHNVFKSRQIPLNYSYAALLRDSKSVSQHLINNGLKTEDKVIIYSKNCWQLLAIIYGTLMAGGCFVLINPETKQRKLELILNNCEPTFIFVDQYCIDQTNWLTIADNILPQNLITISDDCNNYPSINHITFDDIVENHGTHTNTTTPAKPSNMATIIYTSGSTGEPKGVVHTHASMVFVLDSICQYLALNDHEKILSYLPLSFDYGLYQIFIAVKTASTLFLLDGFTFPNVISNTLIEEKITVLPAVPSSLQLLKPIFQHNYPEMKIITSTGEDLPPTLIDQLKSTFPSARIFKMYGQTECKRICFLPPEKITIKPKSVGQAIPNTEVILLDENGNQPIAGMPGVLYVRGQHLMREYWKNPAATEKALVYFNKYNEKLLCTHDIFTMDEDGDLYFVDRSDNTIKIRGLKSNPAEIEAVILSHKKVRNCVVTAINNSHLGLQIIAYVQLIEDDPSILRELKGLCNSQLESHLVPRQLKRVKEIPLTTNGKVDRQKVSTWNAHNTIA